MPNESPSVSGTAIPSAHYWRIVALLMMVVAIGHFNRVGMSVAGAERILGQYHLTPEKMGMVYSGFLLCYTIAMFPGGWFIDRFGPRLALIVFTFGSAIFVLLTGVVGLVCREAQSVWLGLLVVRSLMGVINAPLHPSTARMVYESVPDRVKTSANGLATLAACLGISATYYGLGTLIDVVDWPVAFCITSCLTLVVALVWTLGTHSAAGANVAKSSGAWPRVSDLLRLLSRKSVIAITISYAALGYFQYLFFYWIEYYFEHLEHQSRDVSRRYTTLITLGMGAGMAFGGWLADRVPSHFSWRVRRGLVPALGMLAAGTVFELGLWNSNSQVTLIAFGIAAACIGMCEGPFWTTVVDLGGRQGGTAAAVMNTGGNAGGTISPYLTPLMSAYFSAQYGAAAGWKRSLAVAGVIAIFGAVMWLGVDKESEGGLRVEG